MSKQEDSRLQSFSRPRSFSPSPNGSRSSDRKRRIMTSPEKRKSSKTRYSIDRDRNRTSSASPRSIHNYNNNNNRYKRSTRSRSFSPPNGRRRKSYSRSPVNQRRRHVGTRENPKQSSCIGVFGLSVHTNENKIRQIFSKFGPIERAQVIIDAKTGKSRGFCFVYYENIEDAKTAKDHCSGMEIDDRRIRVDFSITARPHTPTPGVYMGKPTRLYREREYHDRYRDDDYSNKDYNKDKIRYRHSPSPPHYRDNRKRRYEHSRSRSHSPRDRKYR